MCTTVQRSLNWIYDIDDSIFTQLFIATFQINIFKCNLQITLAILLLYHGYIVLHRFERQQFVSACKAHPDRRARDLYGSAHLLRLLSRIDGYLNVEMRGKVTKDDVETLEAGVDALLAFLEKNSHKYFTSKNYAEAEENYVKASSVATT